MPRSSRRAPLDPVQNLPHSSRSAACWLLLHGLGKVSVRPKWAVTTSRHILQLHARLGAETRPMCLGNCRELLVTNSWVFYRRYSSIFFFPSTLYSHILLKKKKAYFLRESDLPLTGTNKSLGFIAVPRHPATGQGSVSVFTVPHVSWIFYKPTVNTRQGLPEALYTLITWMHRFFSLKTAFTS